jgi:hypothetical protein
MRAVVTLRRAADRLDAAALAPVPPIKETFS